MKPIKVTEGMRMDSLAFDNAMVGLANRGDREVEFTIVAGGHALTVVLDADEARNLAESLEGMAHRHEDHRKNLAGNTITCVDRGSGEVNFTHGDYFTEAD